MTQHPEHAGAFVIIHKMLGVGPYYRITRSHGSRNILPCHMCPNLIHYRCLVDDNPGVELKYVASKYGVTVHQIDKWYPSSKVCKCGYIYKDLSLKERSWECPACGSKNERDLLASQNILRKGISELESMDKSNGRKTEVPYVIIQESHSLQ